MPYASMKDVNPAIKGIKPPVTLAQANHIARMADAIRRKGGAESPWAVAIAQFKDIYVKTDGGWKRKGRTSELHLFHGGRILEAVEGTEGKEWDVVLIEAGEEKNKKFYWEPEILERDCHMFEGCKSYDAHLSDADFPRRARRPTLDILGIVKSPRWDPSVGKLGAVVATYHVVEEAFRTKLLALRERGLLDSIGLSVDTWTSAIDKAVGGKVLKAITRIKEAVSVDVVGDAAAGGRFERMVAATTHIREVIDMKLTKEELEALINERVEAALEAAKKPEGDGEDPPTRAKEGEDPPPKKKGDGEDEVSKALEETKRALEQVQIQACQTLLDTKLQASKLPQPFHPVVRSHFEGRVFESKDLDEALKATLEALAEASKTGEVKGAGYVLNVGPDPLRKLEIATHRLFGAELDDEMKRDAAEGIPRLTGIRELYLLLTGDYDMKGIFNPEGVRVAEANVNTGTVTSLVKNALNKVLLKEFNALEPWWRPVMTEMDFTSMQDVTLIKTGSIADLPTVLEGAAYTELQFGDIEEVAEWVKKGAYIGVTLEAIDRDDVQGIRRIPRELGRSARRTLSTAVAAMFTVNSDVGPLMADGMYLFDATPTTGHLNLLTTALSAAEWEVVVRAMFKQTAPVGGNRLGMRASIILVPIDLEQTARRIFRQPWEQTSQAHYETLLEGAAKIIAVPEWLDTNNWAAAVDPAVCDGLCLGYRFGREPELFTADDPSSGSMFTNDELRIKVRFFWALGVADYRPLHKSNVTGA